MFTIPSIASVGLRKEAAKGDGLQYRVSYQDTTDWYPTRRIGGTSLGSKVLVDEESDLMLGAHVFGPYAEAVINLFAIAMRTGLTAGAIKEACTPTHRVRVTLSICSKSRVRSTGLIFDASGLVYCALFESNYLLI